MPCIDNRDDPEKTGGLKSPGGLHFCVTMLIIFFFCHWLSDVRDMHKTDLEKTLVYLLLDQAIYASVVGTYAGMPISLVQVLFPNHKQFSSSTPPRSVRCIVVSK